MTATRVALDAMGGDDAPRAILEGALLATSPDGGGLFPSRLLLVGRQEEIRRQLEELGGGSAGRP